MLPDYYPFAVFPAVAVLLSLWGLAWKGVGLWRAARNSHKIWFVAILVFNTLGILPIVYYFFFSGRKPQQPATQPKPAAKARKKR